MKTYRFELEAYFDIDILANSLEEAQLKAEYEWQRSFGYDCFGQANLVEVIEKHPFVRAFEKTYARLEELALTFTKSLSEALGQIHNTIEEIEMGERELDLDMLLDIRHYFKGQLATFTFENGITPYDDHDRYENRRIITSLTYSNISELMALIDNYEGQIDEEF